MFGNVCLFVPMFELLFGNMIDSLRDAPYFSGL